MTEPTNLRNQVVLATDNSKQLQQTMRIFGFSVDDNDNDWLDLA